jgi:hypothetical protein
MPGGSSKPSQLRHCVVAVGDKLGGDVERAFAICTASLQKSGYLKKGTQEPTEKGVERSRSKSRQKGAKEVDQEYEKMIQAARKEQTEAEATAEKLPEDPWKYFNKVPGTIMVPVKELETIRARPTGIENAVKYMAMAYNGTGKKRNPISVSKTSGGWRVEDGNSTTAIARQMGWKFIPAVPVNPEAVHEETIAERMSRVLDGR